MNAPNRSTPRALPRAGTFTLALLMAGLSAVQAQQVIPAGSEIAFTTRQMGVPVDGQFRKWSATIQFDVKKPEAGKIAFTIDMGSVTLGAADTDAEVIKPDWFHTAKFPQAQFQSAAIKATGKGRYEVTGPLSIKGSTQTVSVPVILSQTGAGASLRTTATGAFSIKRLAFKIGDGAWSDTSMVADEVQVKFKLQLSGMAPL